MDAKLLMEHAKKARERAYTPYSNFQVGAALLDIKGNIHYGCNIENAAYGPTNCAERTALFSAIAQGNPPRRFVAMAVVGNTKDPITPCGVCRQVMIELCPSDMPVYLGNLHGKIVETTAYDLLPGAFDAQKLNDSEGK